MKEKNVFEPHWPEKLLQNTLYRAACDDKGRDEASYLQVLVAKDGDVHVSMQEWEDCPQGSPSPFPSIRVRTYAGGGRNVRTRQALLWLAEAMRLDQQDRDEERKLWDKLKK